MDSVKIGLLKPDKFGLQRAVLLIFLLSLQRRRPGGPCPRSTVAVARLTEPEPRRCNIYAVFIAYVPFLDRYKDFAAHAAAALARASDATARGPGGRLPPRHCCGVLPAHHQGLGLRSKSRLRGVLTGPCLRLPFRPTRPLSESLPLESASPGTVTALQCPPLNPSRRLSESASPAQNHVLGPWHRRMPVL